MGQIRRKGPGALQKFQLWSDGFGLAEYDDFSHLPFLLPISYTRSAGSSTQELSGGCAIVNVELRLCDFTNRTRYTSGTFCRARKSDSFTDIPIHSRNHLDSIENLWKGMKEKWKPQWNVRLRYMWDLWLLDFQLCWICTNAYQYTSRPPLVSIQDPIH